MNRKLNLSTMDQCKITSCNLDKLHKIWHTLSVDVRIAKEVADGKDEDSNVFDQGADRFPG